MNKASLGPVESHARLRTGLAKLVPGSLVKPARSSAIALTRFGPLPPPAWPNPTRPRPFPPVCFPTRRPRLLRLLVLGASLGCMAAAGAQASAPRLRPGIPLRIQAAWKRRRVMEGGLLGLRRLLCHGLEAPLRAASSWWW